MDDSHNPYAPPEARTADPPTASVEIARPQTIIIADVLIVMAMTISMIRAVVSPSTIPSPLPAALPLIAKSISVLFWLWLAYMIHRGRNWARLTVVVLTTLGLLAWLVPAYRVMIGNLPTARLTFVVISAGSFIAASAVLLMPASNRWFKAMKEARNS